MESASDLRAKPVLPKIDTQPKSVAFDTNMLLNIKRFKIDVFEQSRKMLGKVEFMVPIQVMNELEGLEKEGGQLKQEVSIARQLIEKNKVEIVEVEAQNTDEALKKLCKQAIIATNDKELKDSIKELNGSILQLRQRKFLEII